MSGQHTPGPWSARANGAEWVVDAGRKQRVASVNTALVGQEANSRLIAAAPDLMAALEGALDSLLFAEAEFLARGNVPVEDIGIISDRIVDAPAAIAKARGAA